MLTELKRIVGWFRALWLRIKKFWFGEWFDPRKSFLKLPSFWGPFFNDYLRSINCLSESRYRSGAGFDASGDLDKWYQWFQVPIWIFALLIPVIGLFNANHKSEQTKESLRLTGEQNLFSNYYKHVEEFVKHCKAIEERNKDHGLVIHARLLHSWLYPSAKNGSFSPDPNAIQNMRSLVSYLIQLIQDVIHQTHEADEDYLSDAQTLITFQYDIHREFSRFFESKTEAHRVLEPSSMLILAFTTKDFERLNQTYYWLFIFTRALEFDPGSNTDMLRLFKVLHRVCRGLRLDSKSNKVKARVSMAMSRHSQKISDLELTN